MTALLGDYLQSARNNQSFTLKQLATTLPSKPSITFLSRLESGKVNAPTELLIELAQVLRLDSSEVLRLAKRDQAERTLTQEAYLLQLPLRDEDRVGSASSIYDGFGELCYQLGEQMYVEFRFHDMVQAFKSTEQLFIRLGRTDALRKTYYRLGQSYVTLGWEAVSKSAEGPDPSDYFFEAIRYLEAVYLDWTTGYKRQKSITTPENNIPQDGHDWTDAEWLLIGKSLAQSALAHLQIWKLGRENNGQLYFREAVRLAFRAEELYNLVIRRIEKRNDIGDLERRLLADAYHKRGIVAEHIEEETKPQLEWRFVESRECFRQAIEIQRAIAFLSDPDIKHLARMHKDLGIVLSKITQEDMHLQSLWQHTLAMQLHRDFDPSRNPDARQRFAALEADRDVNHIAQERSKISGLLEKCDFTLLDYYPFWPSPLD